MTPLAGVDRRSVIKGAAVATATLAVPLRAFDEAVAAAPAHRGIFGYGVASGDPTAHAVVIWTRATPPARKGEPVATPGSGLGKPLSVKWEVSARPALPARRAQGPRAHQSRQRPHRQGRRPGLRAYTSYWYRFRPRASTARSVAPRPPETSRGRRTHCASPSPRAATTRVAGSPPTARSRVATTLTSSCTWATTSTSTATVPTATVHPSWWAFATVSPRPRSIDLEGYRLRHALHKADRRPAGRACQAPVDHHLRRPRGGQQRLGRGRREPPGRRGRLPGSPGRRDEGLPRVDAVPPSRPAGCRIRAPGSSSSSRSATSATSRSSRPGRTAASRSPLPPGQRHRLRPPRDPRDRRGAGRPEPAPARAGAAAMAEGHRRLRPDADGT